MSQKKQAASKTPAQQLKAKTSVYIERYREIEIYLTLLTRPILQAIIPTSAVGTGELLDKVESELKVFIESKLQQLTGLAGTADAIAFSKDEVGALKLVASTVLFKGKNNDEPRLELTSVPDATGEPSLTDPEESSFEDTSVSSEDNDEDFESNEVKVTTVQSNRPVEQEPVKKAKGAKKKPTVIPVDQVPEVTFGEPTDTMKRARPKGVKPLPQPTPEQMAQMASAQAQAAQGSLLSAQMNQAAHLLPDNLGIPNLDMPLFR